MECVCSQTFSKVNISAPICLKAYTLSRRSASLPSDTGILLKSLLFDAFHEQVSDNPRRAPAADSYACHAVDLACLSPSYLE